jgi:hypothetical protein
MRKITSLKNRFPLETDPLIIGDVKERILCMENDTINTLTRAVSIDDDAICPFLLLYF